MLIASCHSAKPLTGKAAGSEALYMYQWNLTALQGQPTPTNNVRTAYLLFSPGKVSTVSGNTGCNTLRGSFNLSGTDLIKFLPLRTTKMACVGDNNETQFMDALSQVTTWSIVDKQLLLSDGTKVVAKFDGVTPSLKPVMPTAASLNGSWELNYISGKRIAFDGLYPDKKPTLLFTDAKMEVDGHTSCNPFSANFTVEGNTINFKAPRSTMMACKGEGESSFLNMLKKVNKYTVTNNDTLTFMMDDVAVMRFAKK